MRTTSEKTAKQKMILAKAVLAAAERLGLTQDQLALILKPEFDEIHLTF